MPGALAVDRDWAVLDRTWPPDRRGFTSVSLVLDRAGVIRWLHAGGEMGETELAALRAAIAAMR